MPPTTRKEPMSDEQAEAIILAGWRVIDVNQPGAPNEFSRHDLEPEAIETARRFEDETSSESVSDLDDTHD